MKKRKSGQQDIPVNNNAWPYSTPLEELKRGGTAPT